jgi:hypothetical protein
MKAATSSAVKPGVRIKRSTWVSGLSGQPMCRVTGAVGTGCAVSPDRVGRNAHPRFLEIGDYDRSSLTSKATGNGATAATTLSSTRHAHSWLMLMASPTI